MNTIWDKDKRVLVYGSKKNIDTTIEILNKKLDGLFTDEWVSRKILADIIVEHNLKATIFFDGNTVWNTKKLCTDVKRVVKGGMFKMTDYLYKFLSLDCGSIAHFNKQGWIEEYPTVDHLRRFFQKNEFGKKVVDHVPNWYYDAAVAVREMEKILFPCKS